MSKTEEAVSCFLKNGFNCSQSVFSTYSDQLGLDRETALKISCPYGGGMARMACTCGAVTGAYMLIGLKHGKYLEEDNEAKELTYRLVHEYNEKFKELHGSTLCRDLLDCDISTTEGSAYAGKNNLYNTLCTKYVHDSAKIIEEMLDLA